MAGDKDNVIEVSWCRHLLDHAEQDYMSMINSLLIENKQLEELLLLMSQHLDNLAANFVGKDLEGPEAAAAAREAMVQLSPRLEELFDERRELQTLRQERAMLQKQVCEEKMESEELQRKLELALEEASASVISDLRSENGDETSLHDRLRTAEASRAQEARNRELTEVRCALVQRRCCSTVARLEAELREVRAQSVSTPCRKSESGSLRDGLESAGHTPLREEVQALTDQMDFERDLHDRRRALLERYSSPEKVATAVAEELDTLLLLASWASGMKLKFKFTFIDVEEPSPSLRRCASMPATSTYHRSTAECENDYLAGLLQEARNLPIPQAEIASDPMPAPEDLEVACDEADAAGSLGHPYFCRRPCVLLALGHCRKGMACKYCHHAHDNKKQQSFTKHVRDKINRMKGSAKLWLLRDSLLLKMRKVPELASQLTGLVDIIEEGLRHEDTKSSESGGSRLHEKVAVISVAAMLGDMFTRNIEPDIQRRLQEELRRLRFEA
ncbi:unnamed protein product [Symbiodinium sp. CCMP2592]|nr:unnamed protein product [Symbiodinium sp. CCMP2592]